MKKISFIFLILTAVLNAGKISAQDLPASVYTYERVFSLNASASGTNISSSESFRRVFHFPDYKGKLVKSAKLYVEILPAVMPLPSTGSFAATVTILGKDATLASGQTLFDDVSNPDSKSFSVALNSLNPSAVIYNDFTSKFISTLTLTNFIVALNYTNTYTSADIINVKIRYEIEYGLNVNENAVVLTPITTPVEPTANFYSPRVLTFSWKTDGRYYPAYQLQLLRLYNKKEAYVEPACSTTVDWSKATTVNIETDLASTLNSSGMLSYNYTVAEGTGLYVWRVRPVGNYFNGGFANPQNVGLNWSSSIAEGDNVYFADIKTPATAGYFYFKDPDENKNWKFDRSFSEKTNIKESIIYADHLLHGKQVQSYIPSKRATMTMQYVFDYMGRPALRTMTVPQQNLSGLLGYRSNFVQNLAGNLFSSADFDSDASLSTPSDIKIKGTNGFEYYVNNPVTNIPNSGGFPYVRTIFENSTNSRIVEQSGVGQDHRIGTDHTVQTFYSTASDDELIRILGDEAPKGDKVLKTIVLDPNRTASITYTDLNGKVIATCIGFNDDDINNGSDPIPSGRTFNVHEVIDNNTSYSDGRMSSKRISFNTATDLAISYKLPCTELVQLCGSASERPCRYKLVITIQDLKNPSNRLQAERDINMTLCTGTSYDVAFVASDFTYVDKPGTPVATSLEMGPGDFIIEKRLVIDRSAADAISQGVQNNLSDRFGVFVQSIVEELKNIKTYSTYKQFISKYTCTKVEMICMGMPSVCTYTLTSSAGACDVITPAELSDGLFQVTIQPIDPGLPHSKILRLKAECCDIEVPIEFVPPMECPATLPTDPNYDYGFYDYAKRHLEAKGLSLHNDANYYMNAGAALWGTFNNKTTAEAELDQMIYHMIHDQYSANSSEPIQEQYTCENLSKCWINALNAVTEFDTEPTTEDNINNTEDEMDFNSLFDNMPGGAILKLFIGKRKVEKMREEIRNAAGGAATASMAGGYSKPPLLEIFMNCAGYKYASVLLTGGSGTFSSTTCNTTPATVLSTNELSLYGSNPSAFWRRYNFKYAGYNESLARRYDCEASYCFCPVPEARKTACALYMPGYAGGGPCDDEDEKNYDLCEPGKNHTDWSFTSRGAFVQCLHTSGTASVNTDDVNTGEGEDLNWNCEGLRDNEDTDFLTDEALRDQLASMQLGCEGDCENHRDRYTQKVREMFIQHCYNIVSSTCELGTDDVPEQDIALIVDQLIAQCKSMCDMSYLAARTHGCVNCAENGAPTRQYVEIIMGSAREKLFSKLAKQGNIKLDIASKCTADYGQVGCNLSGPPTIGSGFTPPCGKDYDPSYSFCNETPDTFDPDRAPCPLDQLNVNKETQPVKVRVEAQ